jgi:hypothetical protein
MVEAELGVSTDPCVDSRVGCPPAAVPVGGGTCGIDLGSRCVNGNLMIEIHHWENSLKV